MNNSLMTRLALAFCLLASTAWAEPEPPWFAAAAGTTTAIDGDTLDVAGHRVRLAAIDSPERAQTCEGANGLVYECGRDAAAVMASLVRDRIVTCEQKDTDRYRRTVAVCRTEAGDLGQMMVSLGWAVRYARYDRECRYCAAEEEARSQRLGIWSGRFETPEEWRATKKAR